VSWHLRRVAPLTQERTAALEEIARVVGRAFDLGEEFRAGRHRYAVERDHGSARLAVGNLRAFAEDADAVVAQAAERLPQRLALRRDRVAALRDALPAGEVPRLEELMTVRTSVGDPVPEDGPAGLSDIAAQTAEAWKLRDELLIATGQWARRLAQAYPLSGGCDAIVSVRVGGRRYDLDPQSLRTSAGDIDDIAVADRFAYDLPVLTSALAMKLGASGTAMRGLARALSATVERRAPALR
jgi:hypothetical protein